MNACFYLFLAMLPMLAASQEISLPSVEQKKCIDISEDKDRLSCFDKLFGVAPKEVKYQPIPSEFQRRVKLRADGDWNNLGKDAASLSISHVNGEDASQIKAAVVVLGNASDSGWQPFAAYGINKNTLTKDKSDIRTATVGYSGSLFNYFENGFSIWPTVNAAYRENRIDDTQSTLVKVDSVVAIKGLADGAADAAQNSFRILPRFGFQFEDQSKVKAGNIAGNARGGFIGLRFDYWPKVIADRLQFTAQTQKYRDTTVDSQLKKRDTTYTKFGFDYYLYDTNNKAEWFMPILSLEREIGENTLTGQPAANRTQLTLKLKIN